MTKRDRVYQALSLLKKYYPNAHCALDHSNPFELLIATVLSAQCTDERVNQVTPNLFKKYSNPEKLAVAKQADIEKIIHATGFYKNKAKNLIGLAQKLVDLHSSDVPKELNALILLPGVGRKTANVVLGNAFHIISGIVVDTHVSRLSQRLGWTKKTEPIGIEKDLEKLIPHDDWIMISHYLIEHGRTVCKARKAQCSHCFLVEYCPSSTE